MNGWLNAFGDVMPTMLGFVAVFLVVFIGSVILDELSS